MHEKNGLAVDSVCEVGGPRSERPMSRLQMFGIAYVGALNRQARVTSVTAFQRVTGKEVPGRMRQRRVCHQCDSENIDEEKLALETRPQSGSDRGM